MKEWLSQYGYLLIVFAVVCVVAAVIFFFAAKAYSDHSKAFKAQEQEMRRLLALKEIYMDFTEKTLEENDEEELLEGVALSYQIRLQRQKEPEKAYEEMNRNKKMVYVLDVFCADADVKIFFSENGEMVKRELIPALEELGMDDFAKIIKPVYDMYDNENEEVSFDQKAIDSVNEYMESQNILTNIKLKGAKYIKNNFERLKN